MLTVKQIEKLKNTYQTVLSADIVSDPIKWVKDNVKSPESARSASIDLTLTPYLIEPFKVAINGCNDRQEPVHTVSMLGNVGSGKSTLYVAFLNYILAQRPSPSAIVFQNSQESVTFGESRLFPTLKTNPKLKDIYPDDRKHAGKMRIELAGTPLYLLSATIGQLQSKSLTNIILDECWTYKDSMIGEAIRRTHDRQNRMILAVSQGGTTDSEWCNFHSKGIQKFYSWKCPNCGKLVEYDWQHLKFDKCTDEDGKMDLLAFKESVKMQCPFCNSEFADTITNRRKLSESGCYVTHHDNSKLENHIAFNYNALCCYWIEWSTLILEFLEANNHLKETGDRAKLNQFLQKRLAKNINLKVEDEKVERIVCFKQSHRKIQVQKLTEDIEITKVMGVDVQGDGFYYTVFSYCNDSKLYVVDAGKVKTYDELTELQQIFKVPDSNVVIDCGFNSNEVIYQANQRKFYAVNATSSKSFTHYIKQNGKEIKVELLYSRPITTQINGIYCKYLKLSSKGIKEFCYQEFIKKNRLIIYDDIDKFYIKSITAEKRIPYKDIQTQTINYKWESNQNISHYFDILCMSICLLQIRKFLT